MKKGLNFLLAVHNHQPVGNYPEVFEKIYSNAYLPFIEVLEDRISGVFLFTKCHSLKEGLNLVCKVIVYFPTGISNSALRVRGRWV
jgi:hypothetical protein